MSLGQVCTIDLAMGELDKETVSLLPGDLQMKERVDMTLFWIRAWSLTMRNESDPEAGIKMEIILKRKLMNELMTTYLPSILLICITFATTFFKAFFFEAALTVNLTTMLVMTTIFIGVMQMLPSTAYIKMIDLWLIFGQLIPFLEVVLLTAMEYHREGNGSRKDQLFTQRKRSSSQETSVLQVGPVDRLTDLWTVDQELIKKDFSTLGILGLIG